MSLNRPSSLETYTFKPGQLQDDGTPAPGSDSNSIRSRKLSFNPLPEEWDPPTDKHDAALGLVAFEVPKWKRILQVTVSVVFCLFAAGVVFGYAAIKPILKREGAYRDVCYEQTQGDKEDMDAINTCVEIHLNRMFIVAASASNLVALPVGTLLDHYGPRACGLLGSFLLAAGALFMAYERSLPFDGLLLGYLFLALGGPFLYVSSFHMSNAFPRHSGLILALLVGAFDASSSLFIFYRLAFEASSGKFGHHEFFLAYLIVPVFVVLVQIFILPAQSYKTVGEIVEEVHDSSAAESRMDQVDEQTALLQHEARTRKASVAAEVDALIGGSEVAAKQTRREEAKNNISGVWGALHGHTVWEQIRSPFFILICVFTAVQMLRINYFVGSIRSQYEEIFHSIPRAIQINTFFDIALPLGGIAAIPFIGLLLDHTSTPAVLTVLVSVATTIGVLGLIPSPEWLAYVGVVLFVLYRPFYYTAVSDYSAKVFGYKTFGTAYGAIIALSGLFNMSQTLLDYLTQDTFRGDPTPVNLVLLISGVVLGVLLVGYVTFKARGMKRALLEREAERAFAE